MSTLPPRITPRSGPDPVTTEWVPIWNPTTPPGGPGAPINVLAPPSGLACYGDGNQYDGDDGGLAHDDAAALQAQINAAVAGGGGGGPCTVYLPGHRTYAIGTTITVPGGIHIVGGGGRQGEDSNGPPKLVWCGAMDGTIFDVAVPYNNMFCTVLENLNFQGRTDGINLPAHHLELRGTSGFPGAPDAGTVLRDIWFGGCRSHGVKIGHGATNLYIEGGRWDGTGQAFAGTPSAGPGLGYGIYVNLKGQFNCHISGHPTWTAEPGVGGFMFLDAENNAGPSEAFVNIDSLHCEVAWDLGETYSAAAGAPNPYDRRGIFRLGTNSDQGQPTHNINCNALKIAIRDADILSYSVFQITATGATDLENAKMVNLVVDLGQGLGYGNPSDDTAVAGQCRVIGGRIPAAFRARAPYKNSGRWGRFQWGIGKANWTSAGSETVVSWTQSPNNYIDYPVIGPIATYAELTAAVSAGYTYLKKGFRSWVTDGVIADITAPVVPVFGELVTGGSGLYDGPVYFDGTNWRVG